MQAVASMSSVDPTVARLADEKESWIGKRAKGKLGPASTSGTQKD